MKRQGVEKENYLREYHVFMDAQMDHLRKTRKWKNKWECWREAQDEWNAIQLELRAEKKLAAKEIRDRIT